MMNSGGSPLVRWPVSGPVKPSSQPPWCTKPGCGWSVHTNGSLSYHLSKLYRRHRPAFATAGAIAAALVIGLVAAWWQAARATANERKAALEAAKSEHVAQVLKDMLNELGPMGSHGRLGPAFLEVLDATAERIGKV
jgi:hypothetical protein